MSLDSVELRVERSKIIERMARAMAIAAGMDPDLLVQASSATLQIGRWQYFIVQPENQHPLWWVFRGEANAALDAMKEPESQS